MGEIQRQPVPKGNANTGTTFNPADYLPDMANAKQAEELIKLLGRPSIVSKKFIVWHGIWKALNHREPKGDDPGNLTYIDTSLHDAIYNHVSNQSVNEAGKYFERVWQYLMRPHYVITQNAMPGQNAFDNQEPGFFRRIFNRLTGGGGDDQNVNK